MANDPKADLIYAILSMDSYNRGYGSGIRSLETDGESAKIGSYSIDAHTDNRTNSAVNPSFAAGFYAIAYRNGTDTVISYRGTDVKIPFLDSATAGGNDPVNGYGIAVGSTESPQGLLAAAFYRAVTENADNVTASNTVLTGHSLGGGLAGYIGAVSGTQAVTFDHMPFDVANDNEAQRIAA